MTLSKLQAAYRKELNKSVKKGKQLKKQKVVPLKKLAKHKDAVKLSNRRNKMDFK